MILQSLRARLLTSVLVTASLNVVLHAQTGPELLFKPWATGQMIEAEGSVKIADRGSTENSNSFDIDFYDTSGRVRLFPDHRADPRFGWNYTQVHSSGDPRIPNTMTDTSVALGMGVMDYHGWVGGLTIGLGYAGANTFGDGNSWYAKADLLFGHTIDETSSLGIVIDYDGNRTTKPDVPLPGILYSKKVDDRLLLGLGFPFSSIEYKFNDQLTFSATLYIPDEFSARIDYAYNEHFGIFAEASTRKEAFHSDSLPDGDQRLLYQSRGVEMGVRWQPAEGINLILAGGYMFGQRFDVGFDSSNEIRVATPSDEPYMRVALEFRR